MPISLDDLLSGNVSPVTPPQDFNARHRIQGGLPGSVHLDQVLADDGIMSNFAQELGHSFDTAAASTIKGIKGSIIPSAVAGMENMSPEEQASVEKLGPLQALIPIPFEQIAAMRTKGYREGAANVQQAAHQAMVGDPRYDPSSPHAETAGGFLGTMAGDLPLYMAQPELGAEVPARVVARLGEGVLPKVAGYLAKQGINVPMDVLFGAADNYVKSGGELPTKKELASQAGIAFVARNLLGLLHGKPKGEEAAPEAVAPSADKLVAAPEEVTPTPTTPEEGSVHLDDLLEQAGQAQEEARNRPPAGTWQEDLISKMEQRQRQSEAEAGATPEPWQVKGETGPPAEGSVHLDDVLASEEHPVPNVQAHQALVDAERFRATRGAYARYVSPMDKIDSEPGERYRIDELFDKTSSSRDQAAGQKVYEEFGPYRDLLREEHGNTIELVRYESPEEMRLPNKTVTHWSLPSDPDVAAAAHSEGGTRQLVTRQVPINDIVAAPYYGPGKQQEFLVLNRESEVLADPVRERDWIDDLPTAESGPPAEEPSLPPELELTSHPPGAPPEAVQQSIGSDAERELSDAATTRESVLQGGTKVLRKASQIFNALVVPGDDVLLRSGEAGQEAVRLTRPIELVRAQAVGHADALYHDITAGLSKQEIASIPLVLDGKLPIDSPNVTPAVREAAGKVRQFLDDYLKRAEDAGTGIERKADFYPHFREAPIHDVERPLPEFQKFGMESPSFHYHQTDETPGYSMNLGYVMRRYAYNAETELQAIRAFGGADPESILKKIDDWATRISEQGDDGVLAKKILLEKFNMHEPELPSMRSGSRDVAAVIGTMNTLTTPIRHLGKYVNGLTQLGFRGAAKGLAKIAQAIADPAARQEIRESGVLLRNSFDLVMPNTKENAFYRVTRALPWIKATKALDAGGRVMMYFGSDSWIDETMDIARGEKTFPGTAGMQKRAIADAYNRAHNIFGIPDDAIASGNLTEQQRNYARLAASDVSEFTPEKGQLPYAATVGAAGRLFYNLRKFATSQANFMYNNVITPASYGNIKPLARFLAFSALSGAAQEPLLHMVNRQPDAVLNYFGIPLRPEGEQTWDDWRKKAMAIGAIHNLGLIYLVIEGRDLLQAVPMGSAALVGRGAYGAGRDLVNAARVSAGVPSAGDKAGVDLPEWWDEAQHNLSTLEGRNVKDIARSTQLTWLLRKWYREARGLQDQQ